MFGFLKRLAFVFVFAVSATGMVSAAEKLSIATFNVDATPPLGSQVAYRIAERILDPLSARGVVILSDQKPIVLCAVDWIGIGNHGHDAWREALADAAGTTPDRVTVHTLHQHDAPFCDFSVEELLAENDLSGKLFDVAFAQRTIQLVAGAVQEAVAHPQTVTHLGLGKAKVEKVASNRRVLGPDGKVKYVRYSSCRVPEAIAAPEGVIDPYVRLISFYNGDKPLAVLTYYATHPQSFYGKGDVSADFVGLARAQREAELPGPAHIHFNGASGNVAAGKYNDGSPELRPVLTHRLAAGMKAAWESVEKQPITAADLSWNVLPVALPPRDILDEAALRATLTDSQAATKARTRAARDLVFLKRMESGREIELSCLRLGDAYVLHMPGELFVEYQLAAQAQKSDKFVAMAAYGDYGPGYIGTEIAYSQGGYETGPVSRTAPEVEDVLMRAIRELLR